jgi:UDP-MurNAc hydroxylase
MKITNIGGATAILEHKGIRLLFDPWMDDGIFHGAWYHYPPTQVQIDDLGKLDYIYISHIHEDHCSAGTIKHLNRDAEIIIMDRSPQIRNFITNFLESQEFKFKKIHLITPHTPLKLRHGFTVDMVEADVSNQYNYLIDSGLILNWDGFVLYNANDCPPCEKGLNYIKRTYSKVDLALLPYSGGSGYPGCFSNLSHEEKLAEKKRIFDAGMNMFIDTAKELQPRYAMPFADQFVIAGTQSHLNIYGAHPPCPGDVVEVLKQRGIEQRLLLLNSGQSYDFEMEEKIPTDPYQMHSDDDREKYIQSHLQNKPYDHERFIMRNMVPVKRLLTYARERLWEAQQRENYYPEFFYYLDMTDRKLRFQIDLTKDQIENVTLESPLQEPYLKITGSSTLFTLMFINHISWNIADGAYFLEYERKPNVYDPKVHSMLNLLII